MDSLVESHVLHFTDWLILVIFVIVDKYLEFKGICNIFWCISTRKLSFCRKMSISIQQLNFVLVNYSWGLACLIILWKHNKSSILGFHNLWVESVVYSWYFIRIMPMRFDSWYWWFLQLMRVRCGDKLPFVLTFKTWHGSCYSCMNKSEIRKNKRELFIY